MGVDLLLELHVPELSLMGPSAFGTQHGAGHEGIIDHEDHRIERHFDQQGDDRQRDELPQGEGAIEIEREVQSGDQGHADGSQQDKNGESKDFLRVPSFGVPAHVPHEDDIDTQQDDQSHGVRGERIGNRIEVFGREDRGGEQLDIGQPQNEDHGHGREHQTDTRIPRCTVHGVVAAAEHPGEPDEPPSEDFGSEECREGMHGERRGDDESHCPGPTRSEQIADDVDDDDAGGRKLDVESASETDQDDQDDGEQRKDQFVVHAGHTTQQRHRRMEQGEEVDDSGDLERLHENGFNELALNKGSTFRGKNQIFGADRSSEKSRRSSPSPARSSPGSSEFVFFY